MQSFVTFFTDRGGHEFYLWGAYAMTAFVMTLDALATWQRHRRAKLAARTAPLDELQDD